MKTLILITVIFLLQSFSSIGSPIDKGLICKCIETEQLKSCPFIYDVEGFLFTDNDATLSYFERVKDNIKITKSNSLKYSTTDNKIFWSTVDGFILHYELNRKSLILEGKNPYYTIISECVIYSKQDYLNEIEKLKYKLQTDYNLKRKKNKI